LDFLIPGAWRSGVELGFHTRAVEILLLRPPLPLAVALTRGSGRSYFIVGLSAVIHNVVAAAQADSHQPTGSGSRRR